jgi:hypothetical protein
MMVQPDAATILEVRFRPATDGGTQLDLEHRGCEEFGAEQGNGVRAGYQSGWDVVLEPFEQASAMPPTDPGCRHDAAAASRR